MGFSSGLKKLADDSCLASVFRVLEHRFGFPDGYILPKFNPCLALRKVFWPVDINGGLQRVSSDEEQMKWYVGACVDALGEMVCTPDVVVPEAVGHDGVLQHDILCNFYQGGNLHLVRVVASREKSRKCSC